MDVLGSRKFLPMDSQRLVRVLLSDTVLTARIGSRRSEPFPTTIGRSTPQGDALSKVLFVTYLEAALGGKSSTEQSLRRKKSWVTQEG